jgi:Tfp pilus assembly protein PilZ
MSHDNRERERRHNRIPARIPVRLSTIEPDTDPWTGRPYFRASQEQCENLSRGGAFVRTAELLDPGKKVLLELQLPNGNQVEAVGRVAWTKRAITPEGEETLDSGVGVEFLGGASDQLAAIEAFLNRAGDEPSQNDG